MQQPDDLNLSDAALCAMRDAGWIGPLVRNGATVVAPPRKPRKRSHHAAPKTAPTGLRVPQGVTWEDAKGKFTSRISVGRPVLRLGQCGATQEELDALGARWAAAAALRDAGATIEAIREAMDEAL